MEAMENKAHTILHTPLGVHGPQVKNPCSAEKKHLKRNRGKIKSLLDTSGLPVVLQTDWRSVELRTGIP